MADSMGYIGHCVLDPGVSQVYLPLLPGSARTRPGGVVVEEVAATTAFAARNWLTGLSLPALLVRTRLHGGSGGWGTVARLKQWFGLPFADATNRPAGTGIIPSAGVVQWRNGGATAKEWTASYIDRMALSWGGVGSPIDVTMLILPAGATQAATALGTTKSPYGVPYMMQGIAFTGASQVKGGTLTLMNRMQADDSSDSSTKDSDGHYYPARYFPAPLTGALELRQKEGAGTTTEPAPSATSTLTLAMSDAAGANTVTFAACVGSPDLNEDATFDVAQVLRTYPLIDTVANPIMAIS